MHPSQPAHVTAYDNAVASKQWWSTKAQKFTEGLCLILATYWFFGSSLLLYGLTATWLLVRLPLELERWDPSLRVNGEWYDWLIRPLTYPWFGRYGLLMTLVAAVAAFCLVDSLIAVIVGLYFSSWTTFFIVCATYCLFPYIYHMIDNPWLQHVSSLILALMSLLLPLPPSICSFYTISLITLGLYCVFPIIFSRTALQCYWEQTPDLGEFNPIPGLKDATARLFNNYNAITKTPSFTGFLRFLQADPGVKQPEIISAQISVDHLPRPAVPAAAKPTPFDLLPNEVLQQITLWLPPAARSNFAQTGHRYLANTRETIRLTSKKALLSAFPESKQAYAVATQLAKSNRWGFYPDKCLMGLHALARIPHCRRFVTEGLLDPLHLLFFASPDLPEDVKFSCKPHHDHHETDWLPELPRAHIAALMGDLKTLYFIHRSGGKRRFALFELCSAGFPAAYYAKAAGHDDCHAFLVKCHPHKNPFYHISQEEKLRITGHEVLAKQEDCWHWLAGHVEHAQAILRYDLIDQLDYLVGQCPENRIHAELILQETFGPHLHLAYKHKSQRCIAVLENFNIVENTPVQAERLDIIRHAGVERCIKTCGRILPSEEELRAAITSGNTAVVRHYATPEQALRLLQLAAQDTPTNHTLILHLLSLVSDRTAIDPIIIAHPEAEHALRAADAAFYKRTP